MNAAERARSAFARIGTVEPQPAALWSGPFDLPPDVVAYYAAVGPSDIIVPGFVEDYFFPSLPALWDHQSGYRYDRDSGDALPGWDDDWLVIADQGGDPFIFSRSTGRILFAGRENGIWNPELFMEDLTSFAGAVATLGVIIAEAGWLKLAEDNRSVRRQYLDRARRDLTPFVKCAEDIEILLKRVGWTDAQADLP